MKLASVINVPCNEDHPSWCPDLQKYRDVVKELKESKKENQSMRDEFEQAMTMIINHGEIKKKEMNEKNLLIQQQACQIFDLEREKMKKESKIAKMEAKERELEKKLAGALDLIEEMKREKLDLSLAIGTAVGGIVKELKRTDEILMHLEKAATENEKEKSRVKDSKLETSKKEVDDDSKPVQEEIYEPKEMMKELQQIQGANKKKQKDITTKTAQTLTKSKDTISGGISNEKKVEVKQQTKIKKKKTLMSTVGLGEMTLEAMIEYIDGPKKKKTDANNKKRQQKKKPKKDKKIATCTINKRKDGI